MRIFLAAIAVFVASGEASAITRYQTMSMSCASVQDTVQRDGAAILRWQSARTPGLPLYGRYVANVRFCQQNERTRLTSVPTRDNASCWVKKCEPRERSGKRWLFPSGD